LRKENGRRGRLVIGDLGLEIGERIAHAKSAKVGKRGDLIWECEMRNSEFEKREWTERKISYWGFGIGDWGGDCSRPAFPGRAFARKGRKGGRGGSSGGRVTARAGKNIC